jgi:hypothetical protein
MRRSSAFAEHLEEPCSSNPHLHPARSQIRGPIGFLNPTVCPLEHRRPFAGPKEQGDSLPSAENGDAQDDAASSSSSPNADHVYFRWSSRNNRKGRHQLDVYQSKTAPKGPTHYPNDTATLRPVLNGILAMLTQYPVWDVSWLVAFVFTWGSIVWVINAL